MLCQKLMNDNDTILFDIFKKLFNNFQTSGNGFSDNKRFSRYSQNFNCKNLK